MALILDANTLNPDQNANKSQVDDQKEDSVALTEMSSYTKMFLDLNADIDNDTSQRQSVPKAEILPGLVIFDPPLNNCDQPTN